MTSQDNGASSMCYKKPYRFSLWLYLIKVLGMEKKHLISWTNQTELAFKINKPNIIAYIWGCLNGKNNMNYRKFARAMRYYYGKGVLEKMPSKPFEYHFVDSINIQIAIAVKIEEDLIQAVETYEIMFTKSVRKEGKFKSKTTTSNRNESADDFTQQTKLHSNIMTSEKKIDFFETAKNFTESCTCSENPLVKTSSSELNRYDSTIKNDFKDLFSILSEQNEQHYIFPAKIPTCFDELESIKTTQVCEFSNTQPMFIQSEKNWSGTFSANQSVSRIRESKSIPSLVYETPSDYRFESSLTCRKSTEDISVLLKSLNDSTTESYSTSIHPYDPNSSDSLFLDDAQLLFGETFMNLNTVGNYSRQEGNDSTSNPGTDPYIHLCEDFCSELPINMYHYY